MIVSGLWACEPECRTPLAVRRRRPARGLSAKKLSEPRPGTANDKAEPAGATPQGSAAGGISASCRPWLNVEDEGRGLTVAAIQRLPGSRRQQKRRSDRHPLQRVVADRQRAASRVRGPWPARLSPGGFGRNIG